MMAKIRFPSESNPRLAISVLVAVGLFLALWAALRPRTPVFVELIGPGEERLHTKSTGDVAFTLRPGAFYSFKFVVPGWHKDASLKGQFSVADRDAKGIQAFVLNEEDYTSWQKGYKTYRYYDSGNVQQGAMDVPLRAWSAGTYYVVFQNQLPAQAPQNIKANLSLIYSTMWWPGMKE